MAFNGPPVEEHLLTRVRRWILSFAGGSFWRLGNERSDAEMPPDDPVPTDDQEEEEEIDVGLDGLQEAEVEPREVPCGLNVSTGFLDNKDEMLTSDPQDKLESRQRGSVFLLYIQVYLDKKSLNLTRTERRPTTGPAGDQSSSVFLRWDSSCVFGSQGAPERGCHTKPHKASLTVVRWALCHPTFSTELVWCCIQ
ncbi:uncharacterized protein LOC123982382 isoform X2 [Micropterus dolomieu]|uniref:uncharacterized protein LOC123982382 isoform X2 n=1 Tax=Micropterus dolomieu TaxID=147949 RepID=UPI001E8DE343|nr:uncharacterized protein LOC123982382 isoform X2 [Micropterus dolomieu]